MVVANSLSFRKAAAGLYRLARIDTNKKGRNNDATIHDTKNKIIYGKPKSVVNRPMVLLWRLDGVQQWRSFTTNFPLWRVGRDERTLNVELHTATCQGLARADKTHFLQTGKQEIYRCAYVRLSELAIIVKC